VTQVTSKLSGTTLEVTFYLRDLPAALAFHRPNVPANALEYAWELYIDVDDNRQTGASDGTEYSLSAMHWHFAGNSPVTGPIENNVQRNVWYFTPPSSWRTLSTAQMTVDYNAESFTLTADIPNITAGSRVFFETYDRNPDGERLYDYSTCAAEGESGSLSESRRTAPDEDFSRQTHRWEVLSVTVE